MIEVTPHARRREDRSGDPLDGLVNLFDLGIVLARLYREYLRAVRVAPVVAEVYEPVGRPGRAGEPIAIH